MDTVPRIVHEDDMARLERTNRRLIYVIVLLVLIIVGMRAFDIYEDSLYDYSDITVDSTDGSNAAYMGEGASGIINNGSSGSQKEDTQE